MTSTEACTLLTLNNSMTLTKYFAATMPARSCPDVNRARTRALANAEARRSHRPSIPRGLGITRRATMIENAGRRRNVFGELIFPSVRVLLSLSFSYS